SLSRRTAQQNDGSTVFEGSEPRGARSRRAVRAPAMREARTGAVAVGLAFDAEAHRNVAERIAQGTLGCARAWDAANAENHATTLPDVDAVSVGQAFDASVPGGVADTAIAAAIPVGQALDALTGGGIAAWRV